MNRSYTYQIPANGMPSLTDIKFVKTHPDAVLPTRNHNCPFTGDSGYDITAVEDMVIPARGAAVVPVGLKLAYLPISMWIRIESRSGIQFKHGIQAFNGIIDNQYRGDMGIRLLNHTDKDYTVKKGDRVAQLVIYSLIALEPSWSEEVHETERGEKGFGSSGN
jgi:dUTP pyrophosphatase